MSAANQGDSAKRREEGTTSQNTGLQLTPKGDTNEIQQGPVNGAQKMYQGTNQGKSEWEIGMSLGAGNIPGRTTEITRYQLFISPTNNNKRAGTWELEVTEKCGGGTGPKRQKLDKGENRSGKRRGA